MFVVVDVLQTSLKLPTNKPFSLFPSIGDLCQQLFPLFFVTFNFFQAQLTDSYSWKSVCWIGSGMTDCSNCPAEDKLPSFHGQILLFVSVTFWQHMQIKSPEGEKDILSVFFGVLDGVIGKATTAILFCFLLLMTRPPSHFQKLSHSTVEIFKNALYQSVLVVIFFQSRVRVIENFQNND